MSEQAETRRTQLPPVEAEGAGNFAAEPATDPIAGPGNTAVATQMETGVLNQNDNPSPRGEEGNRTGGDPAEVVARRQASNETQAMDVRLAAEAEEQGTESTD